MLRGTEHRQSRAAVASRRKLDLAADRRRASRSPVTLSRHGASSLLLAFLAEDVFAGILHALALVGFGRTVAADFGGHLADLLLVDAGDHDLGRLRRRDGDAVRNREVHVVAEAKL